MIDGYSQVELNGILVKGVWDRVDNPLNPDEASIIEYKTRLHHIRKRN